MPNLILQDAITLARGPSHLDDSVVDGSGNYRNSAAELLRYANDALRELATKLAQEYFVTRGEFACTASSAVQTVPFDGMHRLVDVVRIKDGSALTAFDKTSLDAFNPTWMAATPGTPVEWAPLAADPRRFYLNPPPSGAQVVEVLYVLSPAEFAAGDDTGLPLTLKPAIADYIAARALGGETEDATARADAFMALFVSRFSTASA